jgi:porin
VDSASDSSAAPQPVSPSNVPSTQTPPNPTAPNTTPGNPASPAANPTSLWTQNYLTGNWGGFRDDLKKEGIQLTPVLTADVFGDPSGGMRQGVVTDGLLNTALDVDFDALTGGAVKDLIFHTEVEYIYGPSLSQGYVGDFSDTSDIDAYNTLRLDEMWAQKLFWNKKLSLKIGNMAVDDEYFQSNSASLFINATFGIFTLLANNIPTVPVYPVASPGVRLQFLPTAQTYIMAGVYGMDDTSAQDTNNKNGLRFALNGSSGMFLISEAGYLLNQGPNDKGLQGSYRIGSFIDTDNRQTFASQAAFANGTGSLQGVGADFGVYAVLDQQIYSEQSRIVSFFTRGGYAPANSNFIDYYFDFGLNFTGFIPGRDNDVGGLALGRSHVSRDYSDSQIAQGNQPATAETVIEATYKMQLAPWWSIQPDVQYIVTPSGVEGSHNATVLGLRTTVAF